MSLFPEQKYGTAVTHDHELAREQPEPITLCQQKPGYCFSPEPTEQYAGNPSIFKRSSADYQGFFFHRVMKMARKSC